MIPFSFLLIFNEFAMCFDTRKSVSGGESYGNFLFNKLNPSSLKQKQNQQYLPKKEQKNTHIHILINDNDNDQYDNSNDNDVPPLLPTRATEEIIHRDSSGSIRFKVITYVGLTMIVVILFFFIVWKFCPRSCFCGRGQDEDINGDIGIESGIEDISGQLQIDTIDQNENELNTDISIVPGKEGTINQNEDYKDRDEKEIKNV